MAVSLADGWVEAPLADAATGVATKEATISWAIKLVLMIQLPFFKAVRIYICSVSKSYPPAVESPIREAILSKRVSTNAVCR